MTSMNTLILSVINGISFSIMAAEKQKLPSNLITFFFFLSMDLKVLPKVFYKAKAKL